MKEDIIQIAIIGTGFMSKAHATCYMQDKRVNLRCICGDKPADVENFKNSFNFDTASNDWKLLMINDDIDLIDITLPNFLHYEVAMEAIRNGKSFIIEKPLALTIDQAEEIVNTAKEKGVQGFYAENRLFAPLFVYARNMIAHGEIGTPKLFRINELGSGPSHSGWYRNKDLSGGGALIDIGIHGICLSEWLLDSPIVSVSASAVINESIEETVITNCIFENGVLGQFVCSWGIQGGLDIRVEVFGEQGSLLLDQSKSINGIIAYKTDKAQSTEDIHRPHIASDMGWSYPYVDEWNTKGHSYELRHFIDCILQNEECRSPVERGLRTLKIVFAIYKSIESGEQIPVTKG